MEGWGDGRLGDEDVAEALFVPRNVESGASQAIPGQPSDDPLLECVRAVGAGFGGGGGHGLCEPGAGSAKLDPYKGITEARLQEFPKLTV